MSEAENPASTSDAEAAGAVSEADENLLSDAFCLYLWRDAWGDWSVQVIDVDEVPGADPQPRLVRVRNAPLPGLTTFATLTGSRFADVDGRVENSMDGVPVPIRCEYSCIVHTDQESDALPGLKFLLDTLYEDGTTVPAGTTGGPVFGRPALGRTVSASHLLVVSNLFGFGHQPMRDRVLEMLQLVPITPEEEQYCADHGYAGILGAINGRLFDPSDLNRASIVRRDAAGVWQPTIPD
nr:suppressor of fused domain protein [Propionibacterium sp.]